MTATNNLQLLFPPVGMRLRLDRAIDRLRQCHDNIATVDHGRRTTVLDCAVVNAVVIAGGCRAKVSSFSPT